MKNKIKSFLPIPWSWSSFGYLLLGAFIAAFAIDIFFIPNHLVDGGTVGLAMILGSLSSYALLPYILILLNIPFFIIALKRLGKPFVFQIALATFFFSLFLIIIPQFILNAFHGESLEVVVIGGAILGCGLGLIIRSGGCLDGTEILGIIASKYHGFTVGEIVFICNILVFTMAGIAFRDWHPALLSLITYIVVVKIMDIVIVGLDAMKSVTVISTHSEQIVEQVIRKLGLGVTIIHGRGGFSKKPCDILFITAERLALSKLKNLVFEIDPAAFIAIQDLHEVKGGTVRTSHEHSVHHHGHSHHSPSSN